VPRNQPPWAEQAELLDVVEATQGVLDEVGSAGFAGFVVTPEKCRLDLYWVGAPPREVSEVVRRDRRVVVHDDADHDHAELAEAAEALSPGSPRGVPSASRSPVWRSRPRARACRSGSIRGGASTRGRRRHG
jgi:hypothetical protein